MKRRHIGRYIFLALAIGLLGVYMYSFLDREFYQTYQGWLFDHQAASDDKSTPGPQSRSAKHRAAGSAIGRISIPRLHLTAMVEEGTDNATLRQAVGHIPSTVLPGQRGNVAISGHRDSFFRGLEDLRKNDEVEFSTPKGTFRYEIESLVVVEPQNTSVLASSAENTLTIVTCYPFHYIGSAPKRFVARARQIQRIESHNQ
jgi:sortase A